MVGWVPVSAERESGGMKDVAAARSGLGGRGAERSDWLPRETAERSAGERSEEVAGEERFRGEERPCV